MTPPRFFARAFRLLMSLPQVRSVFAFIRAVYFVRLRGRYREIDTVTSDMTTKALTHNRRAFRTDGQYTGLRYLLGLNRDQSGARANRLLGPLLAIQQLELGRKNLRLLSIGPRGEGEIFNIYSRGFSMKNIRGLDLFTFSPYIDLGDMHAMPYEDDTFDVVICGWVLVYSVNREKACSEIIRVVRKGGFIAVGSTSAPASVEDAQSPRIASLAEVDKLFEGHVETEYFRHDRPPGTDDERWILSTVFSVKK